VYADASFADEISVGSWAYLIPAFPMMHCGVEPGSSNNHLEFMAVVHGLTTAAGLDHTGRTFNVYTDSQFAMTLMTHVAHRDQLPERRAYRHVADLYKHACDITTGRKVKASLRTAGDALHTLCDSAARQELRRYCAQDEWARRILIKRLEARQRRLLKQISALQITLDAIQNQLRDWYG
jgi:ribonuclease HI